MRDGANESVRRSKSQLLKTCCLAANIFASFQPPTSRCIVATIQSKLTLSCNLNPEACGNSL